MRGACIDRRRAVLEQRIAAGAERAGGVDDVVDHDADLVADAADHVGHLRHLLLGPLLGDQREPGAEHLGELLGQLGAAGIARDDHDLLGRDVAQHQLEVLSKQRHRGHVVDGDLEEALQLAGVQVHGQDAIRAGGLDHVGNQLGCDRLARRALLVLARVGIPGHHRRDPLRRGQACGVDHDQQFHQRVVGRRRARLDDEHVRAANRLLVPAVDLAVGERLQRGLSQFDTEPLGDLLPQLRVRTAAEQHQPLLRRPLHPCQPRIAHRRHRRRQRGEQRYRRLNADGAFGFHIPGCWSAWHERLRGRRAGCRR